MWAALWAQAQGPETAPVEWLQYGVAGLVILALLLGWLWPKPAVDHILKANERLKDEILAEVKASRAELQGLREDLNRDG